MNFLKLCLTSISILIAANVSAVVPNAEGAGQCVGLILIINNYKMPINDLTPAAKAVFMKYGPNVQRLAPIVDGCTQGSSDINKFKSCVGKLSNQQDRDFVTGLNAGMNVGQKHFSTGGAPQLKTTTELTCSGIK